MQEGKPVNITSIRGDTESYGRLIQERNIISTYFPANMS